MPEESIISILQLQKYYGVLDEKNFFYWNRGHGRTNGDQSFKEGF